MPYRPDFSSHQPRPALRRYQDRVGRLNRGKQEVGLVLALVESYCEQVGGHLWWRRWSTPEDALNLWTIIDGKFSDSWVPDEVIDDELADYDAGRFAYYGEQLGVVWAEAEESKQLRREHYERR